MKKFIILLILSVFSLLWLPSCSSNTTSNNDKSSIIPQENISYTNFTVGNVIQDGKQALFFNFVSDYTVTKMEIAGTLLDKEENAIHSFDVSRTFSAPSYNPELHVRIDKGLIKYVNSVTFTQIKAYTTEKINLDANEEKTPILKCLATANDSTIENCYASGSTITAINGEINIQLDKNENGCGFRWKLSETNLKPNTMYLVKFENFSVADICNTSIQLETTWVDSTYTWPRYYHVKGKRFDIISSGQIPSDYYQFLKSKTYAEYTMNFSFTHSVDNSKNKTLYFHFWGVENQLSIKKLSIYEVAYV